MSKAKDTTNKHAKTEYAEPIKADTKGAVEPKTGSEPVQSTTALPKGNQVDAGSKKISARLLWRQL